MIKILHVPNSRSMRIVWLMEELGEEYALELVSIPFSEDFLKANPHGQVPAIIDDGVVMGESIAILQYITGRRLVAGVAAAANLTVGPNPDPAAYAQHLQLLHFGESSLSAPLAVIFRTRIRGGGPENPTTQDQLAQFDKRLEFLEMRLSDGRTFATGETFTIADISIGYGLGLATYMKLNDHFGPLVAAYWQRLQNRPAFARAAAK